MAVQDDDWTKIKPLSECEAIVAINEYLNKKGYSVNKLPKNKVKDGLKSPDIEIYSDNKLVAYGEIKCPGHYINQEVGLFTWDTAYNKLLRYTHEATEQFKAYDANHALPWVLIIASNHPQLNWMQFLNRLRGEVRLGNEALHKFYPTKNGNDDYSKWKDLDMILWLQINYLDRKTIYQLRQFVNLDSKLIDNTKKLSDEITPLDLDHIQ